MPSPAAALRVKISPIRMYLASISADLWPVWRMMSRLLTPFMAAWVGVAVGNGRQRWERRRRVAGAHWDASAH